VNKMVLFFGAIAAAVVCALIAVYYAIPGYHHVLTFGSHPANEMQPSHVALFAILAVICVVAALVTRPKAKTSA
jgi:hypothetical protein